MGPPAHPLGAGAAGLSVGEASTGANLPAAAVLSLCDSDGWVPDHVVLAYPVVHPVTPAASAQLTELMTPAPVF